MLKNAVAEKGRDFIFDDTFILYLKESDKSQPYFALKVDNTDVLVSEWDKFIYISNVEKLI